MSKRQFSAGQVLTMVVAVCAAVVLAPVGVMAATGSFVNVTDPINGSSKARVNSGGGLHTTTIDALTKSHARVDGGKLRIGDGSGNLTVDGALSTRDLDTNALVYKTPTAGYNCGAGSGGVHVATLNLARYSKIRIVLQSGPSNQSIVQLYARANATERISRPWGEFTVPANGHASYVFEAPPALTDLNVTFCGNMHLYVYGIR